MSPSIPKAASIKVDPAMVDHVRQLLKNVANPVGHCLPQRRETKEYLDALAPELFGAVLDRAIKTSQRMWLAAADIIFECEPSDAVDRWIIERGIHNPDPMLADYVMQAIGSRKAVRFAELINELIDEGGDLQDAAMQTAGELATESNCAALVRYAKAQGNQICPVPFYFRKFGSEDTRIFLEDAFYLNNEDDTRVTAAWGLCRLGDHRATRYLIDMLDEVNAQDPQYPSLTARHACYALDDVYALKLLHDENIAREAKARIPAEIGALANACPPSRHLSFVLFDDADITLEQAAAFLADAGLNVCRQNDAYVVDWGEAITFHLSLAQGESIRRQSAIIAEIAEIGDRDEDEAPIDLNSLSRCDRRFEISFNNLDEVLDEINTLIHVTSCLQELTSGTLFHGWNRLLT